jgi:predicted HD phosphohydrolase
MATRARATFARMQDSTAADYEIIEDRRVEYLAGYSDRVLDALRLLDEGTEGYAVSRLEHSLQSATRATRDGRGDDYVAMCLLHDIGDTLAPRNHGELAAAILKPYVSEKLTWITKHHPVFQLRYYGRHVGADPDAREVYRGHEWFDDTVEFCELYDENCFDVAYQSLPLAEFEPLIRALLERTPRWDRPDL